MTLVSSWIKGWRQYKHRFTPWLAFNWSNRTKRLVESHKSDKLIPDTIIHEDLLRFCDSLHRYETAKETTFRKEEDLYKAKSLLSRNPFSTNVDIHLDSLALSHEILGFTLERKSSSLSEAGGGVFVTKGSVPANTFVCLYPGTIYRVHDPLFFQSLKNQFIFRCADQIHIDGNDRGLSKLIFKSCTHRDRRFPYWTADATWMSMWPINPLAVGQYVNNQTTEFPANVAYQEFDIPSAFPIRLSRYLPYVEYSGGLNLNDSVNRLLRGVALVSLRSINVGEELFSTYFTVIEATNNSLSL